MKKAIPEFEETVSTEMKRDELLSQESLDESLRGQQNELARFDQRLAFVVNRSTRLHHQILLHVSVENIPDGDHIVVGLETSLHIFRASLARFLDVFTPRSFKLPINGDPQTFQLLDMLVVHVAKLRRREVTYETINARRTVLLLLLRLFLELIERNNNVSSQASVDPIYVYHFIVLVIEFGAWDHENSI